MCKYLCTYVLYIFIYIHTYIYKARSASSLRAPRGRGRRNLTEENSETFVPMIAIDSPCECEHNNPESRYHDREDASSMVTGGL